MSGRFCCDARPRAKVAFGTNGTLENVRFSAGYEDEADISRSLAIGRISFHSRRQLFANAAIAAYGFSSWPLGGPGWAKPCFCCPAEPRS
jgi:hypothetical protein